MKASQESTQFSESTRFYDSQDTQATSLFVTQISNLLKPKRGARKSAKNQYRQLSSSRESSPEDTRDRVVKKDLQVLVAASDRLKATGFEGVLTEQ